MYIAVIDYDMGNISSVKSSFMKAGAEIRVTADPDVIKGSAAVILPGVGAYGDAFKNLEKKDLVDVVKQASEEKPFLGICLGMQLLFDYSMEDGKHRGLGIFKGSVQKIPSGVKIPHMGWNQIDIKKKDSVMLEGIESGEFFYFVHSYHAVPDDPDIISSTAGYGTDLVASVERDNVYGFQFHPEKSSTMGQVLVKNFIKLAGGTK